MGGGNSHQRKMARKATEHQEKNVTEAVVTRLSVPPEKSRPKLSTDRLLAIIAIVLGVVLAFVGLTEMFRLWVNLAIYIGGFICILVGGWKWETAATWGLGSKIVVGAAVIITYSAVLAYPVYKQYTRETAIGVTFKDSPLFTWWRRQVIKHDLAGFRGYLSGLNIEVPDVVPPFTIGPDENGRGSNTPPNLPKYRGDLGIGKLQVKNRMAVTEEYGDYVISQKVNVPNTSYDLHGAEFSMLAIWGLNEYFNASYWGKLNGPHPLPMPFAQMLWDIRLKLGQDYTDHLAAYTLKILADSPAEGRDSDFFIEFWKKAKIADGIVESDASKWPQIVEILKKDGQPVDKL